MFRYFLLLALLLYVSWASSVFYTPCTQSLTRVCPYGTNVTDWLLNLKKGGQNSVETNTYNTDFFICEQYNYNCGYLEQQTDFLTITEGVQLNITTSELAQVIPSDPTLRNLITPYLGASGSRATCLSNFFPLTLTDTQSNTFLSGYLSRLTSNLSTTYNANKAASSLTWSSLNINIITSVLEIAKIYMNDNIYTTSFWNYFLDNNWAAMSFDLKASYVSNQQQEYLHSAYLIDSVTTEVNKYQSINFLADESSTIGSSNFNHITAFLSNYASFSKDEPAIMSVSYYDLNLQTSVSFNSGNTLTSIMAMSIAKTCRCAAQSNLGQSLNSTINNIMAANLPAGVNKIIVALVGTTSLDNVYFAAEYARALGITIIVIAVGGSYDLTQVKQLASTTSNLLFVPTFSDLDSFAPTFQNYLNKQFVDVAAQSSLPGCIVRVPTNPNYYRIPRSSVAGTYSKVTLTYSTDPEIGNAQVYTSHYDPFPDAYTNCNCIENYRTSIYTFEYYVPSITLETIPLKKSLTVSDYLTHTFLAVSGTDLTFSIKVQSCNTINCTEQRAAAASISSKNYNIIQESNQEASNVNDLTVFASIGVGLAGLALGTYAVINIVRKFSQSVDQPQLGGDGLPTSNNLGQQINPQTHQQQGFPEDNEWNNQNYYEDDHPQLEQVQNQEQFSEASVSSNKSIKSAKSQKSAKSEKSKKSEKREKSEKSEKSQKSQKSQKSEQSQKSKKSEKSQKSQKSKKSEKSNKSRSNSNDSKESNKEGNNEALYM